MIKDVITRLLRLWNTALDQSIAMMERWEDAKIHEGIIKKFKALRKSADAKSFSVRLVDNIILATALASFLTYLVCKHVRAERVGWFSDRDSITTSHQGIAGHFYGVNVSACCQRLINGWRGPDLGLNGPVEEGGALWCDAHLRVPDYFAGTISAWNIEENRLVAESGKYSQMLVEAIADKPNVRIIRLNMDWRDDELAVSSSQVEVSRR